MTAVTIIGIGSPFGADRLGWHAIERLKTDTRLQPFTPDRLSFYSSDRPGMQLLDYLRDTQFAILVDAIRIDPAAKLPAVKVIRVEGDDITATSSQLSSHEIGVADALAMGRALNALPERTVIYGLAIDPETDQPIPEPSLSSLCDAISAEVCEHMHSAY